MTSSCAGLQNPNNLKKIKVYQPSVISEQDKAYLVLI